MSDEPAPRTPKPKKAKKVYPETLNPPEKCNPASRFLAATMKKQQKAIALLGGDPYPDEMIDEIFLPTLDRMTGYLMPKGLIGDAMTVGLPFAQGTMADLGLRKLLAKGAVIMLHPDTREPAIRLPDGTFLAPGKAVDMGPRPASDVPPVVHNESTTPGVNGAA